MKEWGLRLEAWRLLEALAIIHMENDDGPTQSAGHKHGKVGTEVKKRGQGMGRNQ